MAAIPKCTFIGLCQILHQANEPLEACDPSIPFIRPKRPKIDSFDNMDVYQLWTLDNVIDLEVSVSIAIVATLDQTTLHLFGG